MFAPICREIFTLSFEIMVILDWTSPLMVPSDGMVHILKIKKFFNKSTKTLLWL